MRNVFKLFFLAVIILGLTFCRHKPDTSGIIPPPPPPPPDSTFANQIFSIVQNHCLDCHSGSTPANGMSLENYAALVDVANSGRLMGAIRHDTGYFEMPEKGEKLSDYQIARFQEWINLEKP